MPHGARDPLAPPPLPRLGEDPNDLPDGILGALWFDGEPVLEESIQDKCCTQADYANLCLDGDSQFSPGLTVLRHVHEDNPDVERPVPPVEEGAVVDVGGALQLVQPERDYGGRETDVRHAEEDEDERHQEVAVQEIYPVVESLYGEEDAHHGEAYPADPQAEADDVVFTDV